MKPDWESQVATLAASPSRVTTLAACLRVRKPTSRTSTMHGASCAGVTHPMAIGPGDTLRLRLRLPLCKTRSILRLLFRATADIAHLRVAGITTMRSTAPVERGLEGAPL